MASWTRIDYNGLEDEYARYNFHDDDDLAEAASFLEGPGAAGEGPSVLLLSADGRGAGRSYFLEALAFRLRSAAAPPVVWHLDLAGFEPDRPQALAAYLMYQIDKRGTGLDQERNDGLVELLKSLRWPPSDAVALLLSLLLELDEPRQEMAGLAEGSPQAAPELLLERLAAESTVVLHATDFAQLTEPLRRYLVELAERRPRFFVAFSCFGEAAERVAPGARHEVLRLEIEPLSQDELRQLVQSAGTGEFPEEQVEALWRSTGGKPALVGPRLEAMAENGLLEEGVPAEELRRGLAGEVDDQLAVLLEANEELGKPLRSVLLYGALCGEVFPPKLLLELMGLDEELADEVIDLIDATLVEELGFIDDLEFRHPGFPGLQIYRLAHPQLAATILQKVGAEGASAAANVLLEAFEKRLPPWTRAAGQLHLALSRQLGPAYQKTHLDRLAWWVGPENAAGLEALVRQRIAAGELDFEGVWKVLKTQDQRWPPYRRLALLSAVQEALAEAWQKGGGPEMAEAYASVLAKSGSFAQAREIQENLLESRRQQFGAEHPETLNAMETLALTFYAEKGYALSRALQDQVLEIRRKVFGPDHPETLAALWNLAVTLSQLDEIDLAKKMLERAAADMMRVFGPKHPIVRAVEKWLREKRGE